MRCVHEVSPVMLNRSRCPLPTSTPRRKLLYANIFCTWMYSLRRPPRTAASSRSVSLQDLTIDQSHVPFSAASEWRRPPKPASRARPRRSRHWQHHEANTTKIDSTISNRLESIFRLHTLRGRSHTRRIPAAVSACRLLDRRIKIAKNRWTSRVSY